MKVLRRFIIVALGIYVWINASTQTSTFVDEQGILRWTETSEEVCAFGVNYSEPFSSWRQHEELGVLHEKAIDADVFHLARMGLDGYRIHVWETYISDYEGNLLFNKHLQLFDYLLYKLKERNIKIFITPMNYYEGSPSGFIHKYGGKKGCLTDTASFPAQKNFLTQFVSHVNPYTGIACKDDPDIIAFEINNEPFNHGDRPDLTTTYINRMLDAIRGTGCEKPIFYNLTHNIDQIDNYCAADIQGGTFQWYPTGLVANHDQKGNILPNVDQYPIPFANHPRFKHMAKAVYELSPADVGRSSHLYPVMARSFREAGVQFAAQFAYDPMYVAYANIEYKTHYLSLPYAPKKSMGMAIASEVFHSIPLRKSYGRYPDNTTFDAFRVSYEDDLAEMVSHDKFLYTNHTSTKPPKPEELKQVAGTGNSPVISYKGTGAYFLDQLEEGVWRLEVMPDAIWVRDPFEDPRLDKEVSVVLWKEWPMTIQLPDLGSEFSVQGLNEGNETNISAEGKTFPVNPGSYLLIRKGKTSDWKGTDTWKNIRLNEFYAPESNCKRTYVLHKPPAEIAAGSKQNLKARVVSLAEVDRVELIIVKPRNHTAIPMEQTGAYEYTVKVPAVYLHNAGFLRYYITIKQGNGYQTFPGGMEGKHPLDVISRGYTTQILDSEPWQVRILQADDPVCLFDAEDDGDKITKPQREKQYDLIFSPISGKSFLKIDVETLRKNGVNKDMRDQTIDGDHSIRFYCREKLIYRLEDLPDKKELILYGYSLHNKPCTVQLALIMTDGTAYGATLPVNEKTDVYTLPLNNLHKVKTVLLPRPYPTFLPYWFEMEADVKFDISKVESIQFSIGPGIPENEYDDKHGVAVGRILLQ